jgi:dienelactone hydrolase
MGGAPVVAGDVSARPTWLTWVVRVVCVVAVAVVAWVLATAWDAVVHGHPAYAVLLAATVLVAVLLGVRAWRRPRQPAGWRSVARGALVVLALAWIAVLAWLKPFVAVEPALAAMRSDGRVTVAEYPTRIVMTPTRSVSGEALFFQPGARVDARAYAAVLRPLAEHGVRVVITKQPLGIAFLNTFAFASTAAAYPEVATWVVGGHSLGGTVACIDAEKHDTDQPGAGHVSGLLLYASYPATDMSASLTAAVLSISGSDDGLATPANIDASKANLPPTATFTVIQGAVHAYFGDYGPQPGDGTPTITHDDARSRISTATVDFVAGKPAAG